MWGERENALPFNVLSFLLRLDAIYGREVSVSKPLSFLLPDGRERSVKLTLQVLKHEDTSVLPNYMAMHAVELPSPSSPSPQSGPPGAMQPVSQQHATATPPQPDQSQQSSPKQQITTTTTATPHYMHLPLSSSQAGNQTMILFVFVFVFVFVFLYLSLFVFVLNI